MEGIKKMLLEEAKNTDPTKSSPIPEMLDLGKTYCDFEDDCHYPQSTDKETKEEYIIKNTHTIGTEQFTSLLSKGILHVSDIIQKDGNYYTRKMPLEQIEPSSPEEKEVEVFILNYLFGDWDRYNNHNLIINNKNQFVHFDYGEALQNTTFKTSLIPFSFNKKNNFIFKIKTKNYLNKRLKNKLKLTQQHFLDPVKNKKDFIYELNKKINEFEVRLNDVSFFDAIIKKSNMYINDKNLFPYLKSVTEQERINELRLYLLNRVNILKNIIK